MATYKVIQDIEAEDHILGPLSLRQFIYGLIAAFFLYLSFICLSKGAPYLLALFLPPALFTGFLAFPFGKDQPTEVWALAKLRFLFKPRRRIWNQGGIKELVTITVPKKIERHLTNGLSENEVNSRLKALASTIDSRGWAIKNVNVNLYGQPGLLQSDIDSDRLIDIANLPQAVPSYDVQASDDILDETNNPIAQQFDQLINDSTRAHREKIINEMGSIRAVPKTQATATGWFMPQAASTGPQNPLAAPNNNDAALIAPGSAGSQPASLASEDEVALTAKLKAKAQSNSGSDSYSHLRTLQPLGAALANGPKPVVNDSKNPADAQAQATSLTPSDPAILSLASNNDLNVAALAREARRTKEPAEPAAEVTISLR